MTTFLEQAVNHVLKVEFRTSMVAVIEATMKLTTRPHSLNEVNGKIAKLDNFIQSGLINALQ